MFPCSLLHRRIGAAEAQFQCRNPLVSLGLLMTDPTMDVLRVFAMSRWTPTIPKYFRDLGSSANLHGLDET